MTGAHDRARVSLLFQIFRTNQLNARLVSQALEPTGLRGDDYAVYSYLLHGPMTLTQLADGTGMPLTTVAGYVKRFEARGHIIKEPNPADGRSHLLSLTDACREWILDAAVIFTKTVSHLHTVMQSQGVDVNELVGQLQHLQQLLEQALDEVNNPEAPV
ncbi:MAG TPA: MarR family winged helix-turn-helix transcriptional regulator [Jiangellaceae bacterium]